jgi:hypothetical protein
MICTILENQLSYVGIRNLAIRIRSETSGQFVGMSGYFRIIIDPLSGSHAPHRLRNFHIVPIAFLEKIVSDSLIPVQLSTVNLTSHVKLAALT